MHPWARLLHRHRHEYMTFPAVCFSITEDMWQSCLCLYGCVGGRSLNVCPAPPSPSHHMLYSVYICSWDRICILFYAQEANCYILRTNSGTANHALALPALHHGLAQHCMVLPLRLSNSITTRTVSESSRDILGSYYALKGHSTSGQGGSPWSIHSVQMVLEIIRLE